MRNGSRWPWYRSAKLGVIVAGCVFVSVWAIALVSFASASPVLATKLPVTAERPAGPHNLVARQYGPLIKASSAHWQGLHHPAFVVDEHIRPTPAEKWMSAASDQAAWLELSWEDPRQVRSVSLVHAGAYESPHYAAQDYTVRCLPEGQPKVEVRGNRRARSRHLLSCSAATGVRLEFSPGQPAVRLYEVKVMGQ